MGPANDTASHYHPPDRSASAAQRSRLETLLEPLPDRGVVWTHLLQHKGTGPAWDVKSPIQDSNITAMSGERIIPIVNLSQSSPATPPAEETPTGLLLDSRGRACDLHFGYRPLQPLRLPHAQSRCSARTIPSSAGRVLSFEEIERVARSFVQHGVARYASPVASRFCDAAWRTWSPCSRTFRDVELTLTTNGVLLTRGATQGCRPGSRVTVSPGRTVFKGHERCGLVSDVLATSTPPPRRSAPLKINMVVKRV